MESIKGKKVMLAITKSNWGGAQAYVYALAEGLRAEGASVSVLAGGTGGAGDASGVLFERLSASGIRTIFLPALMRDISILRELKSFAHLVSVLRKERPDVVHLNSSKMGGIGSIAGRLAGVPHIVFTAHGWAHREDRSPVSRLLIWLVSFVTVLMCHRVIVVSQKDKDDAPAPLMRRKLRLVHNGLKAFPLIEKSAASQALGIPPEETVLLMNAELHPNKGIDIAIHALALLQDRFPHLSLACISAGSERESLIELAATLNVSDRVRFLGFVPDARTYLLAGDIFLMPSRKEGFPFALLEAGIAGLPVIASRTGGIPEIIKDGLTGALVPVANATALAESLAHLLSDPGLCARLGTALKDSVHKDFSEEAMLEGTLEAYA